MRAALALGVAEHDGRRALFVYAVAMAAYAKLKDAEEEEEEEEEMETCEFSVADVRAHLKTRLADNADADAGGPLAPYQNLLRDEVDADVLPAVLEHMACVGLVRVDLATSMVAFKLARCIFMGITTCSNHYEYSRLCGLLCA